MWMMPLHLHVNQKSDYDDMNLQVYNILVIVECLIVIAISIYNIFQGWQANTRTTFRCTEGWENDTGTIAD